MPTPINTQPYGLCFDAACEYIWFTGKLTNTVGRIKVDQPDKSDSFGLEHFELPTLGAIPIYIELGPDNNVWGTCLSNSIIFRVTTGEKPVVDEMSISDVAKDRMLITIKPDHRGLPFICGFLIKLVTISVILTLERSRRKYQSYLHKRKQENAHAQQDANIYSEEVSLCKTICDRLGTITFKEGNYGSKRENSDQEGGEKKKAQT